MLKVIGVFALKILLKLIELLLQSLKVIAFNYQNIIIVNLNTVM